MKIDPETGEIIGSGPWVKIAAAILVLSMLVITYTVLPRIMQAGDQPGFQQPLTFQTTTTPDGTRITSQGSSTYFNWYTIQILTHPDKSQIPYNLDTNGDQYVDQGESVTLYGNQARHHNATLWLNNQPIYRIQIPTPEAQP